MDDGLVRMPPLVDHLRSATNTSRIRFALPPNTSASRRLSGPRGEERGFRIDPEEIGALSRREARARAA